MGSCTSKQASSDPFGMDQENTFELTETERNMLPDNLVQTTKIVMAPPGKLGIVIDATVHGPVVHFVNPDSALHGKIEPGDIIVAIDEVDTRALSASGITALMVQTADQHRKLTVQPGGGSKKKSKKKKKSSQR